MDACHVSPAATATLAAQAAGPVRVVTSGSMTPHRCLLGLAWRIRRAAGVAVGNPSGRLHRYNAEAAVVALHDDDLG